jgi:hypothetical protein
MYANWPLTAPNSVVVRHNTIAIDGAAYTEGTVNGIYVDIDLGIGPDVAELINSISTGEIVVSDNVITGAIDSNAGLGYGLHVPIAFGPTFARYNIFWNNEDDSNNAIDVSTGPGNGNNISEDVSGPAANPLFDGSPLFGYLAGSPAIGSSSTGLNPSPNPFPAPFDAISPNRGYNQISNTNAPVISALDVNGTPSLPVVVDEFLATEDITVSWVFTDIDLPQDANQTNFILRVDNLTDAIPNVVGPFNGNVDGPLLGANLSYLIPAGTLLQGRQYEVFVEIFDSIGLSDSDSYVFTTAANSAPTASDFRVDEVVSNLAVNNTNPKFSFVYDDIDGDNMASVTVNVYRVSANCGVGPNCAPLTPTTDPNVTAPNSVLIGSKTLVVGVDIPAPVAPTDLVELFHYQLSAIIGPILANEDYEWTVELTDAAASTSPVYGTDAGAGITEPTLIFSTVDITAAGLSNLTVDGFDNSMVRVVLANPKPANAPVFGWVYTGAIDDMQSFDVRITRTGAGPSVLAQTTYPVAAATEVGPNAYTFVDPTPAVIDNGRIYTFEIRVRSFLGDVSDWQQVQYTRNQAPTASAMFADAAALLGGPVGTTVGITPTMTWTHADPNLANAPAHETLTAYRLEFFDNAGYGVNLIHDTGKVPSNTASYVVPDFILEYDQVYFVRLSVWDVLDVKNTPAAGTQMGAFRTPVNLDPAITDITMDGAADNPVNFTLNTAPQFDWTYTDPEGRPQHQFSVEIYDATDAVSYAFATPMVSAATSYVINPADLVDPAAFTRIHCRTQLRVPPDGVGRGLPARTAGRPRSGQRRERDLHVPLRDAALGADRPGHDAYAHRRADQLGDPAVLVHAQRRRR